MPASVRVVGALVIASVGGMVAMGAGSLSGNLFNNNHR